jgi:hypothetical protein
MENKAKQQSVEDIKPEFHSIDKTNAVYTESTITYNESGLMYNDANTQYGGSDRIVDPAPILVGVDNTTPSQETIVNL